MTRKVGFVGLGIMGTPMAQNLMAAGYELVVYNRSPGKMEELAAEGAEAAENLGEVVDTCDVIITMLPGPPEVREVVAGEGGLLEGAGEGTLIVDMSTSSPVLAQELAVTAAEKKIGMLDAPVSGGDTGAEEGSLSIMAGGTKEDFGRAKPLFEVMGASVVHVGEPGAGQTVKACNQIVVALVMEAMSEALVLGSKAGVEPEKILEALSGGLADNKVMQVKGEKFLSQGFTPGGKVKFHHKDLGIALAAGREYGAPLPLTAVVDQMFGLLIAKGRGKWDHSSLITLIQEWSGDESSA